ncbi:hypothetical protein [Cellulomonas sp. Y8]|uniref:hypothetical protein n=1 Tax=Cellulomonas sp. Y8 TaxID=2591145 RepID=UPI003D74A841
MVIIGVLVSLVALFATSIALGRRRTARAAPVTPIGEAGVPTLATPAAKEQHRSLDAALTPAHGAAAS